MKDDCSARHNGKPFAEWRKEWEMEERYNFRTIESKWQKIWDEEKAYKVEIDRNREKFYVLVEFPYPSGAGCMWGIRVPIPRLTWWRAKTDAGL